MNKADEDFIKQAFKEGGVKEKGVHLVETSVSVESCQLPTTGDKTSKTSPKKVLWK